MTWRKQMEKVPTEEQMRKQTYKTMVALEGMATLLMTYFARGALPLPQKASSQEISYPQVFEGDVVIKGDLQVEGTTAVVDRTIINHEHKTPASTVFCSACGTANHAQV
jgi:hypothetical protein